MNTPNHQSPALQFEGTTFNVVERDGERWLRSPQIGGALGYAKGADSIDKIYKANASEFSADMTALVSVPDLHPQNGGAGQNRTVRVFSLRGAHLLGMFARTEKAKAFRRWVLDVLEAANKRQPAPTVETSELLHTLRLCRDAQAQVIALQTKEIERMQADTNRPKRAAPQPLTREERQMIHALAQQGMSGAEIARRLGRSSATVSYVIRTVRDVELVVTLGSKA